MTLDRLQQAGAYELRLGPLTDEAVAQIAEDVLGAAPDPGLLHAAGRAEGGPLLLVELLGGLRDEDSVIIENQVARLSRGMIPERLRSSVQRRLDQIRAFIGRHLADPDLTPEVIARAHRISVRYLHKIFEAEDTTVSRWIQSRRLEACRRDLLRREAANRTIVAVAHRWGFTSAAHFSRVFRAAYGMSPSKWRATRTVGVLPAGLVDS